MSIENNKYSKSTFHILIYGCQMNYADSARIKAILTHAGMVYVDDIKKADIVIFDTCSVRQKSEDKIFGKMLEIEKHQKVWMTWCMVQHYLRNTKIKKAKTWSIAKLAQGNFVGNVKENDPIIIGFWDFREELKNIDKSKDILPVNTAFNPLWFRMHDQFPNTELFFRIDDTWFLPLLAEKLGYRVKYESDLNHEYSQIVPHDSNQIFSTNTKTAFVPISTWCSQFCAYCIVPYARWLEKNRSIEDISQEVRYHLDHWVEEIVLLGQIVNKHPDFVQICKQVLSLEKLKWLRYTSPYPTFFSKELLALHENEPKMCPHIHMPLQSGSDEILKKMFRGYNRSDYIKFVDDIRALKRPISITSDIIVWFPWESEQDFEDTLELVKYARFDTVYIGIYSPRPGTLWAKKYIDDIPKTIKKKRRDVLNDLLRSISASNNQKEIWDTKKVMISRLLKNNKYFGYTDNMKNIVIENNPADQKLKIWDFANINITWWESFKLYGEVR